jgi:hypothetical protein
MEINCSKNYYSIKFYPCLIGGSTKTPLALSDEITVAELIARFWIYAQGYYVHADGNHTNEPTNIKLAMRPLNMLYGHTKVKDFRL